MWIVFTVAVRQQVSITAKSSRGKLESRRREAGWDFASYRRPKLTGRRHTRDLIDHASLENSVRLTPCKITLRPAGRGIVRLMKMPGSPRARLRGFVNLIVRYSMSALTDVLGQPLLRRFGDFDSSRPRPQKRGRATLLIED